MHIALCDDSTNELSHISALLEDYNKKSNNIITYETFQNSMDLLETMGSKQFDLLLLDILMPGGTGLDAAKEIRRWNKEIPIIFLTSSREFAVESYRVKAEDYILKPVREDEIFHALDKQIARLAQEETYLTLKTGGGILKLPLSQIVYIEVINRRVYFFLVGNEVRETYGCLADYEKILQSDPYFYKPHRSYIVNLRQMTELTKDGFLTTLGNKVPVSRDTFASAKTAYMKYLLAPTTGRAEL